MVIWTYIFIIYILIINITGLVIMGYDKKKAIQKKWRIRERTLFFYALAGGSIGIFTGMRLFRHKTKHMNFKIGIPVIIAIQILLFVKICI